ncbi:contact-dependent growth inhibition system immunity protein [Burkholderia dolosa]|uniref:contact-dependent growth inhibition system immunity protein n=1 Tax=Burkholderia dolosa TaxID=152500 RepID=UPI0027D21D34|nr:contact-dependent growth inhibition system immunity protein [Burkholderia dolosa]
MKRRLWTQQEQPDRQRVKPCSGCREATAIQWNAVLYRHIVLDQMKINTQEYPRLFNLLGSYLGQDSDLWGNNFDEIITLYKSESTEEEVLELLHELNLLQERLGPALDDEFLKSYGYDFNPTLWGFTTASFFDALRKNLQ